MKIPFGKTEYESSESLEGRIITIIESIRKVKDVYIGITSREEVFEEFEREKSIHSSSTKLGILK